VVANTRKLSCKYSGGVEVPNSASWLSSAVRVVLVADASVLVSFKSAAYAALGQCGRCGGAKLRVRGERERLDVGAVPVDRVEAAELAGRCSWNIRRQGNRATVVRSQAKDAGRRLGADCDSLRLCRPIGDARDEALVGRLVLSRTRREETEENAIRGRSDRPPPERRRRRPRAE
jgi:hypothetical protein